MTFRTLVLIFTMVVAVPAFAQTTDQGNNPGTPIADAISAPGSDAGTAAATPATSAMEMADELLARAASICAAAQDNLGEDETWESIPACVAHATMLDAFWASTAKRYRMWLTVTENDVEIDVATSEKWRDIAMEKAAATANILAATKAAGTLAAANAANALAEAEAAGELATAEAMLALEAVGTDPEVVVADNVATGYTERFDAIDAAVGYLTSDVANSIWIQRNICSANPDVSWCP